MDAQVPTDSQAERAASLSHAGDAITERKSGYRLEYAASSRAKCSGPKPCSGSLIAKGELRLGTLLDYNGNKVCSKWRHWGCTTERIISNFKQQFDIADEIDGFDGLRDEDKYRIHMAWTEGCVAEEDIPATARKGENENDIPLSKKIRAKRKKVCLSLDFFNSPRIEIWDSGC
ncbi:poly polymerase and DNA-ligase Zn-finger region-domain-containing protein [Rhizoctonia solani]|nr:poly polymerase and DNA-ligase Zn-finger region-domain-containing protein [Rhizoctonia solani]